MFLYVYKYVLVLWSLHEARSKAIAKPTDLKSEIVYPSWNKPQGRTGEDCSGT